MNTTTRVLVAYGTKHGSTAEIADVIATELAAHGAEVDCLPAHRVSGPLDDYGAVVLGSAVYARRWRPDARRLLRRHRDTLRHLPFWIFSSGPVGPDEPDPAWGEPPRVVRMAQALGVRDHAVFGGRVPARPRGPVERALVRNAAARPDRRDWEEIRAWAGDIARSLPLPVTSVPAS